MIIGPTVSQSVARCSALQIIIWLRPYSQATDEMFITVSMWPISLLLNTPNSASLYYLWNRLARSVDNEFEGVKLIPHGSQPKARSRASDEEAGVQPPFLGKSKTACL